MLSALRGRAFNRGSDSTQVDDTIEHAGRRAWLIKRARAFPAPYKLPATDGDAVTAYMPNPSGVLDNNFVADRSGFPKVMAPNRGNFIGRHTRAPECLKVCAASSQIDIKSAVANNVAPRTTQPLDDVQAR